MAASGVFPALYDAARAKYTCPITYLAASEIIKKTKEKETVFILTGAGCPPRYPKGESDGPPGAVALARSLHLGLNLNPIIITEKRNFEPIYGIANEMGMNPLLPGQNFSSRVNPLLVLDFPCGKERAKDTSFELLQKYQPSLLIAVERIGANKKGVYHSMKGLEVDANNFAFLDSLVELAQEKHIFTIGIGDNGNELGCGIILDEVQKIQPWGKVCQCPCQSGMASSTEVDILLMAAVSNWGAYGINTLLAYLLNNIELMHTERMEEKMLEVCVKTGCVDGDLDIPSPTVDGISLESQKAIITLLRETVIRAMKTHP
jgi:D-glutamate cyclase